jgi:acetyltransferase-like isoleucine patch superfamily enzyme
MATLNAHLEHDWSGYAIPKNIRLHSNVYLESSYAFAAFFSGRDPGLVMREGSGAYGLTSFMVGPVGRIDVGPYTCLSSTALSCHRHIQIGAHCLLAWGSVITDAAIPQPQMLEYRGRLLMDAASNPYRPLPPLADVDPVVIDDNVWIGFHAYIGAGVRIGRGSVVSCKTVVTTDIPLYTVVAGNPAKVIARLDPDDTGEAREAALRALGLTVPNIEEHT